MQKIFSEKIQSGLSLFVNIFSFFVMILNLFGGIISGIWLIIIGNWSLVIFSLILSVIATRILSLILAPTLLIMYPATKALENRKYFKFYFLAIVSNLWTYLVMTFWCVGTFIYIHNYSKNGTLLPYMLLAYCVATAPWTYMASKERSDELDASFLGALFVCLGSIALMIISVFCKNSNIKINLWTGFTVVMTIALISQMILIRSKIKPYNKEVEKSYSQDE